jgi:hypothetical protein
VAAVLDSPERGMNRGRHRDHRGDRDERSPRGSRAPASGALCRFLTQRDAEDTIAV